MIDAAFLIKHEGYVGKPYWPPTKASGVTLDYGYDLGHQTSKRFRDEWGAVMDANALDRLAACIGKKGRDAQLAAIEVRDIRVSRDMAGEVFSTYALPRYAAATETAFPGMLRLPIGARTALVSLVYNRGGKLDENDPMRPETWRREEMRFIADAVREGNVPLIADYLVIMARLWAGGAKEDDGLVTRRIAEATLCDPEVSARLPKLKGLWAA